MKIKKCFSEIYSLSGFRARSKFKKGIPGDSKARVVELVRRQKKRFVQAAVSHPGITTINVFTELEIWPAGICGFTWNSSTAESTVNIAKL